jgi:hypothetical protein
MGDLETIDDAILMLKESISLDDLALEDLGSTTDRALAVRLHRAASATQLRELWQHRLRLVTTRKSAPRT